MLRRIFFLTIGVLLSFTTFSQYDFSKYNVYYVKSARDILPQFSEYIDDHIQELWTVSDIKIIERGTESDYATKNAMFIRIDKYNEQISDSYGNYQNGKNYILGAYFYINLDDAKAEIETYPTRKVSINKYQHFTKKSHWAQAISSILQSQVLTKYTPDDVPSIHKKTLIIRKGDLNKSLKLDVLATKYCCKYKLVDDLEYFDILLSNSSEYAVVIATTKMADDKVKVGGYSDDLTTGFDRSRKLFILDLSTKKQLYSSFNTASASSFGFMKRHLRDLK